MEEYLKIKFTAFKFSSYAKLCLITEGEDICRILLQKEPELIEQKSYRGWSILHSWADSGKFWPYDCLLQSKDSISSVRTDFASLISHVDEFGSNPLHILAAHDTSSEDEVVKIAELVIKTYKNEADSKAKESKTILDNQPFPWLAHNNDGATPLELAINHGKQKLAKYILSLDNRALLECHQNALLFAIDKGCDEVADTILEIVDKQGWTQILNNDKQMNVLHLAPKCKSELTQSLLYVTICAVLFLAIFLTNFITGCTYMALVLLI